jgi:membrane protease YdiL (CAAX protease family)
MPHPLDRLSARLIFATLIVTAIVMQIVADVAGNVVDGTVGGPTAPVDPRLYTIVATLVSVLAVLLLARRAGLDWARVFGPPLTRESLAVVIPAVPVNIVAILMLIASGTVFILLPLSYLAPELVERFFFTTQPIFVVKSWGQLALLLVVGGVIAPITEEALFRGILMQRWARRWGTLTGVFASSALFALMHQEWLGRFVAGVLLSALYLRTRRLWAPIAVHSLTNVLVMGTVWTYRLLHPSPPEHSTTIADLRAALPSSAWKLALGVALVVGYVRLYWGEGLLMRVLRGGVSYDELSTTDLPATASMPG